MLAALGRLARTPGLVVCDGYGLAHPRRFGLASHLGVLTGLPTIGVAKNPFTFRTTSRRPDAAPPRRCWRTREEVGRALRTQKGVKPVFVSVGHRNAAPTSHRASGCAGRPLSEACGGDRLPASGDDPGG